MKIRRMLLVLAVVLTMLTGSFVGCTPTGDDELEEAEVVKFGVISFLTGPAAPWGIPITRAIQVGAEMLNDEGGFVVDGTRYKWEVIIYDSGYVPAEAVSALNRLIFNDEVSFVNVGGAPCALACLPLLQENELLSLNNAGGGVGLTNPDNPLFFRYDPVSESMYASLLPWFKDNENVETIAVINPDDDAGEASYEAAKMITELYGMNIVANEFFERGSTEFTPLLTRVLARNPDLIDTSYSDPTSSALIVKQARELGFDGPILLPHGPDPILTLDVAGPHAEGIYMAIAGPFEPETEIQQKYYDSYVAQWPAEEFDPTFWLYTDMVPALTMAIVKAQSFDPYDIADALEDLVWETPVGTFSFGGTKLYGIKRQLLHSLTLVTVQDGEIVFVKTADTPEGLLD